MSIVSDDHIKSKWWCFIRINTRFIISVYYEYISYQCMRCTGYVGKSLIRNCWYYYSTFRFRDQLLFKFQIFSVGINHTLAQILTPGLLKSIENSARYTILKFDIQNFGEFWVVNLPMPGSSDFRIFYFRIFSFGGTSKIIFEMYLNQNNW